MAYQKSDAEQSGRQRFWHPAAVSLIAGCCGLWTGCGARNPQNSGQTPLQKFQEAQARLPANFPADIPLMPGLSLTGTPQSDSVSGSGQATFSSTAKRDAVVTFFDKAMRDQDWSEDEDRDASDHWLMAFTKGRLKATITVIAEGATCLVTILYETQK